MTDLQAAVAIPQLGKIEKSLAARRISGEALTKCLNEIDGVLTAPVPKEKTHTYFAYQFAIDPDKFTVDRDTMVKAIKAEGLNIMPSYLPKPLYHYDFLQKTVMYNSTKCPLKCGYYNGEMDYTKVNCVKAEYACKVGMFMQWNEKITVDHANDMGKAIRKVLEYYHK
jgi:dTDP-4-amino-4,6-dideoxygalactose transaminase